jgi:glycosyltransferase involved in cell wall biosynthesis
MKICILTPRFPFPENGGDVLRINSVARYLKSKGHQLILISFYEDKTQTRNYDLYDKIYLEKRSGITSFFNTLRCMFTYRPLQCGYYWSSKFLKKLEDVIREEKPDLYISHLLRMTPYLEKLNLAQNSIIEMTDALSKTYSLSSDGKGSFLKRMVYKIERKRIFSYEKKVIVKFPKVVLVSQRDIDYLSSSVSQKFKQHLTLHTNGVDCLENIAGNFDNNRICFVGNMRTLQNQDAVLYFVKEVFPVIKEKIPEAKFYIIGAQPSEQIKNLGDNKNIFVTGFVENIQHEIALSCLAVAPIRIAAGIQNKVLMAMGCGVPVVLSSLISKAIPELISGKNCIIEDDKEEIADNIVKIMKDQILRKMISINAYNMVIKNYSWFAKLQNYEYFE